MGTIQNKIKIALVILLSFVSFDLLMYTFQPFGDDFKIYSDFVTSIAAVVASAMGFYAFKAHGHKDTVGRSFLAFGLGFMFQAIGEFAWSYQDIVLGSVPTISFADIFYVMVYPFFIAGFYFMWKLAKINLRDDRKTGLYFALKILGLLTIVSVYGFYPNFINPDLNDLEKSVLGFYILMAFVMLAFAVTILFSILRRGLFSYWIIIVVAFSIFAFADITYSQLADLYDVNNPVTALWDIAYLTIAFGLFYNRQTFDEKDYDSLLLSQKEEELKTKIRKETWEDESFGDRLVKRIRKEEED